MVVQCILGWILSIRPIDFVMNIYYFKILRKPWKQCHLMCFKAKTNHFILLQN
jgi:hypothetical protein